MAIASTATASMAREIWAAISLKSSSMARSELDRRGVSLPAAPGEINRGDDQPDDEIPEHCAQHELFSGCGGVRNRHGHPGVARCRSQREHRAVVRIRTAQRVAGCEPGNDEDDDCGEGAVPDQ